MHEQCDICRGRGVIGVPVYRPLRTSRIFDSDVTKAELGEGWRDFACPQCAPKVAEHSIAFVQAEISIDPRYEDQDGYAALVRRDLLHAIAEVLAREQSDGFLVTERGPLGEFSGRIPLTGTIGVVSKTVIASMEQRIAERQMEVAAEVVERVAGLIRMWGRERYIEPENIPKLAALGLLDKAVDDVKRKREKQS